jgi:Xaa-Pro aminopeptidase
MLDRPRPSVPRDEYAERRARLRDDAREAGFDGLVVWSMGGSTLDRYANVFYLTNHYDPGNVFFDLRPYFAGFGQAVVVLPVDGAAILVVNQPDWRDDLVDCDEVRVRRDLYAGAVEAVRDAGLDRARLGLTDEERIGATAYRELTAGLPAASLERADELLLRRRRVKSPAELDMMRYSSAVSVAMMDAMLGEVAVGKTDGDVVAAGYDVACRLGAQPYDFAMASGPEDGHLWWSRLPSWNWHRPYEPGDIVHPDIYGAVDGYYYDFVRSTVVGGEPSPAQLELLEGAIGCIHAACAAARAGNRASDVYTAGRAHLREIGLDHVAAGDDGEVDLSSDLLESIGHGIGVGWDEPVLTPKTETVLEAGMTLAVEQHVSRRGVGTVRYEETLIVTDGEPELMTSGCRARWW